MAHQALEAIEPISGEDILIIGCGPVGLLAVGIAKAMGATKMLVIVKMSHTVHFYLTSIFIWRPLCYFSIACDIFDDKLLLAKQVGADVVINTKTQDLKKLGNWTDQLIMFESESAWVS